MTGRAKLIDPSKDALTLWLNSARLGDQCQVITAQGEVYAYLTKLKPATAKLPMTGIMGQDNFPNHKSRVMELLEVLGTFNGSS